MKKLTINDTWCVHHPVNSGMVQVVSVEAVRNKIYEKEDKLKDIAAVANFSGLIGFDEHQAIVAIRKLVEDYTDCSGSLKEQVNRVRSALKENPHG